MLWSSADIERFFSWVVKTDSCWLWTGAKGKAGYGTFRWKHQGEWKTISAHRFSFFTSTRQEPVGGVVCHRCDVKLCVNPAHLWIGTHRENVHDYLQKHGHPSGGKARVVDGKCTNDDGSGFHVVSGSKVFGKEGVRTVLRCKECHRLNAKKWRKERALRQGKEIKQYRERQRAASEVVVGSAKAA